MFENLKIIELASVLAGPDVGTFFSELGAEVIKIENKLTNGDITRQWKNEKENEESLISSYFATVNYKKKYKLIDFTDPKELNYVVELIKSSDIVIANFKKTSAEKYKLDYKSLKKINPKLIYGNISGFSDNSSRVAYDVVLQAETGFMSINGEPDSKPLKMPVALIDVIAAHQLKEGLLVALLRKEKEKKGSLVEVSLYDAAISSLKNQACNWLNNKFLPTKIGSLHPNIAPYGEVFTTKDNKQIVLAIGSDLQFKNLLKVLGAEELLNKNYSTNYQRLTHRSELENDLAPYFRLKLKFDLLKKFHELNIPAGSINNIEEVFMDKNAKKLIVEETINGVNTKRIRNAIFKIS